MAPIGPKRAIIATACKMPCIIQVTLRDDKLYRAPGVDYEQLPVERNASRWLRKFKGIKWRW